MSPSDVAQLRTGRRRFSFLLRRQILIGLMNQLLDSINPDGDVSRDVEIFLMCDEHDMKNPPATRNLFDEILPAETHLEIPVLHTFAYSAQQLTPEQLLVSHGHYDLASEVPTSVAP